MRRPERDAVHRFQTNAFPLAGKVAAKPTDEGKYSQYEDPMSRDSRDGLTNLSKILRRNMTKEEKHLWYDFLKKLPITVHRQQTLGNYIVDFYIPAVKLIIELDGSQHFSEAGIIHDKERDDRLRLTGNAVIRFSNHDISSNFEGICIEIIKWIRLCGMGEDWSPYNEKEL